MIDITEATPVWPTRPKNDNTKHTHGVVNLIDTGKILIY